MAEKRIGIIMHGVTGRMGANQHLAKLFRLADQAGLLADPPLACRRMKQLMAVHGVA